MRFCFVLIVVCLVDRNCGKGREILDSGKKLGYFKCFKIISYAMIVVFAESEWMFIWKIELSFHIFYF
jgi:hypothetical protein